MEFNKNLLIIFGSPRPKGNSSIIGSKIVEGFTESGLKSTSVRVNELNIFPCIGCLKCNKTGKCESHDDEWNKFLLNFKSASHIIIASPIYFHHLPGKVKILLDRFRSQIQIQMTPKGLIHNPRWQDKKKYAFVFSLGDRSDHDTISAKNVLTFWAKLFGAKEKDIHFLTGYGLAIQRQVSLSKKRLLSLYDKLDLPMSLAEKDYKKNQSLLQEAFELGRKWKADI